MNAPDDRGDVACSKRQTHLPTYGVGIRKPTKAERPNIIRKLLLTKSGKKAKKPILRRTPLRSGPALPRKRVFLRSGLAFPKTPRSKSPNALRKKKRAKAWEVVREKVIDAARIGKTDFYQCHHCGQFFPREEICADHWPYTRAERPDLFLDPSNLVASCKACNTSDNPNRRLKGLLSQVGSQAHCDKF